MKAVYWTPEALARLKEIQHYIIKQNAPKAARDVVATILSGTRRLQTAPLSGRKIPDYPDDDLRELLKKPYRIIYRVTEHRIEILTVMHCRQLLPATVSALRTAHKKL